MRSKMPEGSRFQCPSCGTPVVTVEFPYHRFGSTWALLLGDCGHSVSLDLIRDAWGIEVPEPSNLSRREGAMSDEQYAAENDVALDRASMEDFRNMAAALVRVEALAAAWDDPTWRGHDTAAPFARAIRKAIAVPEQRVGGSEA